MKKTATKKPTKTVAKKPVWKKENDSYFTMDLQDFLFLTVEKSNKRWYWDVQVTANIEELTEIYYIDNGESKSETAAKTSAIAVWQKFREKVEKIPKDLS